MKHNIKTVSLHKTFEMTKKIEQITATVQKAVREKRNARVYFDQSVKYKAPIFIRFVFLEDWESLASKGMIRAINADIAEEFESMSRIAKEEVTRIYKIETFHEVILY